MIVSVVAGTGMGEWTHGAATAPALAAVAVLGVFSTALAAILYFRLIKSAGPAFVSQLNYLIPLWAVLVGVLFLGERPELKHLLALSTILGGILLVQLDQRAVRPDSKMLKDNRGCLG
jgi:drug/metabolite transporter (DMT)-like permease